MSTQDDAPWAFGAGTGAAGDVPMDLDMGDGFRAGEYEMNLDAVGDFLGDVRGRAKTMSRPGSRAVSVDVSPQLFSNLANPLTSSPFDH